MKPECIQGPASRQGNPELRLPPFAFTMQETQNSGDRHVRPCRDTAGENGRMLSCLEAPAHKPESVIRLWGDCPLVSCSMLLA